MPCEERRAMNRYTLTGTGTPEIALDFPTRYIHPIYNAIVMDESW
jgi:hypothetical protein